MKENYLDDFKIIFSELEKFTKKYYKDEEFNVDFGDDPDSVQKYINHEIFLKSLDESIDRVKYLNLPIISEGYLNYEYDRFYINDTELHAGMTFEVLIDNEIDDPHWQRTRIEYDFDKSAWYLVGISRFIKLEGLKARSRFLEY